MALSVHGRKTHEVLIMTYILIVLWLLGPALLEIVSFVLTGSRAAGLIEPVTLRYGSGGRTLTSWSIAPYRQPGPGRRDDLPGIPGGLPGALGGARGPGDGADPPRGAEAGGAAGGRRAPRPSWLRRLVSALRLPGPSLDSTRWPGASGTATRPSRMMRVAWGLYAALGLLWVYLAALALERHPVRCTTSWSAS